VGYAKSLNVSLSVSIRSPRTWKKKWNHGEIFRREPKIRQPQLISTFKITGCRGKQQWVLCPRDLGPWGRRETKLNVSRGNQILIKWFVIPTHSNNGKKTAKKSFALRRLTNKFALVSRSTTWLRASWKFKLLFPLGITEFFGPRELANFDPRHVTRSPPIGKRILVGSFKRPTELASIAT